MHPLGLVIAFSAFGLVSGLGLFISANVMPRLWGTLRRSPLRESPIMFLYTSLLLVGIGLVFAGGYATYRVIYG